MWYNLHVHSELIATIDKGVFEVELSVLKSAFFVLI